MEIPAQLHRKMSEASAQMIGLTVMVSFAWCHQTRLSSTATVVDVGRDVCGATHELLLEVGRLNHTARVCCLAQQVAVHIGWMKKARFRSSGLPARYLPTKPPTSPSRSQLLCSCFFGAFSHVALASKRPTNWSRTCLSKGGDGVPQVAAEEVVELCL